MVSDRLASVATARSLASTGVGRMIRERHNLSLSDIANEIGATKGQISYWERGVRLPRGERGIAWGQLMKSLMSQSPQGIDQGRGQS